MKRVITIFCVLFTLIRTSTAQPTSSSLAVENYDTSLLPEFLSRLRTASEDTGKLHLLLKVASIYHRKHSLNVNQLDSSLIYSSKATTLSNLLKDTAAHNEATFLACKSLAAKNDIPAAKNILKQVWGEQYVRLLLVLSEYYINNVDAGPQDLLPASTYLQQANKLSTRLHSRHWLTETTIEMAKYHFRRGEFNAGKICFYQVINYYHKIGDKAAEAHWWSDLGAYMPDTDSTYADQLYSFQRAMQLFKELGDKREEADQMAKQAFVYSLHNEFNLSVRLLLSAISLKKAGGIKKVWKQYLLLSEFYSMAGNMNKALKYAFLGLKNMEDLKANDSAFKGYQTLGNIYSQFDDYLNAIKYYKLCLSNVPVSFSDTYLVVKYLTDCLIKQGRPQEAVTFLKTSLTKTAPQNMYEQQILATAFANCYNALKNFKRAEKYFLEAIKLDKQIQLTKANTIHYTNTVSGTEVYYNIGKFYMDQKKFATATDYIRVASTIDKLTPGFERDVKYLQFKLDSAAGNYIQCIKSYQRYTFLKDSLSIIAKNKEFSTLQIQFQTSQKENAIKLLRKQLELSAQTRNFTYAGILALTLLLGLYYNRYRLKQNKNRELESRQKIINDKNASLEKTVSEKEWLLKEVHHRVKNNLQVVISLLNAQSDYLENDIAVDAILESRHRIQAMSMLHQRIYQSENMASIAILNYIKELVYYLKDSFNTGKRIIFKFYIQEIELNLVQAVPVGLILNEAITNSLKYAFPNHAEGQVEISFYENDNGFVLSIMDDGIGLPAGFNASESNSFGLKLISGLSEDLGGELFIESQAGTSVTVTFGRSLLSGSIIAQNATGE